MKREILKDSTGSYVFNKYVVRKDSGAVGGITRYEVWHKGNFIAILHWAETYSDYQVWIYEYRFYEDHKGGVSEEPHRTEADASEKILGVFKRLEGGPYRAFMEKRLTAQKCALDADEAVDKGRFSDINKIYSLEGVEKRKPKNLWRDSSKEG